MRIILAQSSALARGGRDGYIAALVDRLTEAGHVTQRLDLPPIAVAGHALTNAASHRLLGTASADALICLDAGSAVLAHPRKIVWLLDDGAIDPPEHEQGGAPSAERGYLTRVLHTAIGEASAVLAPSRFAIDRLDQASAARAQLFFPALPAPATHYDRRPGPELIVLTPSTEHQRPELLIACLAGLPEPYRARWIAPNADTASVARLRRLASEAGVEQRLAIDQRAITAGERAFLMAHSAALVALEAGSVMIADHVQEAMAKGVAVIGCNDAGALAEVIDADGVQLTEPTGDALAKAVIAAAAARPSEALGALATTGWAPLLEAIGR